MTTATITEEATSKYAQAGSTRLHYNEAGAGPAVVMLHGSGPGASGWSNFQRNIGPLSAHHRVLLVDQPGYGKSDSVVMTEPRNHVNARAVFDLLNTLGIEKASLVGNSMGAAVALDFAVDHLDRVDKLVLMGGGAFGPTMFSPQPTEGIRVLNEGFEDPTPDSLRRLIRLMVYDASFMNDELLQQRVSAAKNPAHLEARKKSTTAVRELSLAQLAGVTAKTLIIHGKEDRVVPLEVGLRTLATLPNAEMHIFPKSGHWVQFEKYDDFNRLVEDFLDH